MGESIGITLNGFKEKVRKDITLEELVSDFGEHDLHVIIEHNGKFVYPDKYAQVKLSEGDAVEFINPSFGG